MDRTAWIIIGICAALLGLNIYMGNNKKAETAPIPAPQAAAAAANAPVAGVRPGAGTSAPEQASVNKALEEDKTAPITLVATQEVNGRQEPFITYTFNRIGGSIGTVTLHNDIVDSQKVADHNITINEAQQRGIGELVFNMDATQDPSYDNTVYKEVKRTADSVTLEGYDPARQLFISKTYTLHPVKNLEGEVLPGSKYLIRLTVSLLNKSPNVQDLRYMGIFGGSAYPIAKSEPKDTYTHFFYHADGSLEQEVPSYFTGGFFSSAKARVLEGPLQDLTYAGVMSQYYATILLPQDQSRGSTVYATRQEFPLTHEGNTLVPGVTVAMGIPNLTMAPNEIKTLTYDIYTGPKFNAYLRDLNLSYPAISDIMAYGWLVFLSVPMNWLLNLFHGWFGNWGVADHLHDHRCPCSHLAAAQKILYGHETHVPGSAGDGQTQGEISGRPSEGEHGNDEAVPEIRHQPGQRLRPHAYPDSHFLCLLPCAPVFRRTEGAALLPVDDGSFPA